jgi:hypothetical protein
MNRSLLAGLVCLTLSCSQGAERGRPETLNPILGAGLAAPPTTKPNEPVKDLTVDLGVVAPAWRAADVELPRLIRAIIARGSWVDEHHTVLAHNGVLRVRHRPDVVAQVRKLVQNLRARLMRPIQIQVAFVEAKAAALDRIAGKSGAGGRWNAAAFRAAVKREQARSLARVVLSSYNGRWALSDRVSNQVFLSGVKVADGAITPQTTTLASGFTIQAAAWRWGEERAVVAVTGLYTGEAVGAQSLTQKVHRELPRQKTTERQWEAHDAKLELPVREMLEFQGQITVTKSDWTVAALLPKSADSVQAVLIKADWRSPPTKLAAVAPLSEKGYALQIIPVALPTDSRPRMANKTVSMDNRTEIKANSASWFKKRAKTYQQAQKSSTYNFQDESGALTFSPLPSSSWLSKGRKGAPAQQQVMPSRARYGAQGRVAATAASSLMPQRLEQLRTEVMQASWPEGTALEFLANHVFVVHEQAMADKVRLLLEGTHTWRNRRVLTDVTFPVLSPEAADKLKRTTVAAKGAAALRSGRTQLPRAFVQARGGSWCEVFVGEMHTVISSAWSPDRSSPPVHVYWRGARLALMPHLSVDKVQRLDLHWRQHRLERVAPRTVAGTLLQQPVDSIWGHDQTVTLLPKTSLLVGLHGEKDRVLALLINAQRK